MGKTETVITRISGEAEAKAKLDNLEYLKQWGFSATECAMCGISNSQLSGVGLLQCARCRKAHYCGVECLQKDFQDHIQVCGLIDIGTGPRPPAADDTKEPDGSSNSSTTKQQQQPEKSPIPSKKKKKKGADKEKKKGKKAQKESGDLDKSQTVGDLDGKENSGILDHHGKGDAGHDAEHEEPGRGAENPSVSDALCIPPDQQDLGSNDAIQASSIGEPSLDSYDTDSAPDQRTAQSGVGKLLSEDSDSEARQNRPGVGKLPSAYIKCFDSSNERESKPSSRGIPRKWQPPTGLGGQEAPGEQDGFDANSVSLRPDGDDSAKTLPIGLDPTEASRLRGAKDTQKSYEGESVCTDGDNTETVEEQCPDSVGRLDAKNLRCHSPHADSTRPRIGVGRLPSASIKCFDNNQGVPNKPSPKPTPRIWKSSQSPRPSGIRENRGDHRSENLCRIGHEAPRKNHQNGASDDDSPDLCGSGSVNAYDGALPNGSTSSNNSCEERTVGKLSTGPSTTPKSSVSRRPGKLPLTVEDCNKGKPKVLRGNRDSDPNAASLGSTTPAHRVEGERGVDHKNLDGAQPNFDRSEPIETGEMQSLDQNGSPSTFEEEDSNFDSSAGCVIENTDVDSKSGTVGKLKTAIAASAKSPRPRQTGKISLQSVEVFQDPMKGTATIPRGVGKLSPAASNQGTTCPRNATSMVSCMECEEVEGRQRVSQETASSEKSPLLVTSDVALDAVEVDGSIARFNEDEDADYLEGDPQGSRIVGKLEGLPTASPNTRHQRKTGKLPQACVNAFEDTGTPNRGRRAASASRERDSDSSNPQNIKERPSTGVTSCYAGDLGVMDAQCGPSSGLSGRDDVDSSESPEVRGVGKLKATGEDHSTVYSPKTRSVGKLPMENIGCFESEDVRGTPAKLRGTSFESSPLGSRRGHNALRSSLSPLPSTGATSTTRSTLSPSKLPSGAIECFDSPSRRSPRRLKSADHLPTEATECFEHPAPTAVRRPVRSSPGKLKSFAMRAFAPRTPSQDNLPPAFSAPRRKWTPPHRRPAPVADSSENEEAT